MLAALVLIENQIGLIDFNFKQKVSNMCRSQLYDMHGAMTWGGPSKICMRWADH